MKNNLHTTEKRLLDLIPKAQWVCLKTQRVSVAMASGSVVSERGDHVNYTRSHPGRTRGLQALLLLIMSCYLSTALPAQTPPSTAASEASATGAHHAHLDRSGKPRKGKASYYGQKFYSKKMADGTSMNPQSDSAASKTLPLGTKARVTNLENGKNEVVEIRDRGPYVKDRIVDVSPKTADKLGLKENGTAPVEVKPVEVPQADGSVKPGAGAAQTHQ
ncbi:septal ring lytic transglycosylase RlpA family protein [Caballeronia sp.]|uniref:septal ring lytic transglycosylase RlpA family protein n=1 Tax=Caballeronia sp. TaxID=1931223 RepID=UPI003C588B7E